MATLTQVQINTSLNVLQNISFLGSLNGITTNTFSFLSGLNSNIQNQINSISNTTPVGTVISFAGSSTSLSSYLKCDGSLYNISSYPNLYNVIGTMYGGDSNQGLFFVPNYQGIFLRSAGNQTLDLQIPSNAKNHVSPRLLRIKVSNLQINYVTSINQSVKSFLERNNSNIIGLSFTTFNAVSSLQYSTASDTGVIETFHSPYKYKLFYKILSRINLFNLIYE